MCIEPAQARVKVIDVRIAPGLRVGYVMGVGDAGAAGAIEQLGADVRSDRRRESSPPATCRGTT